MSLNGYSNEKKNQRFPQLQTSVQPRREGKPSKQPCPSVGPQAVVPEGRLLEKWHCCPMRSPFLNGKQLGWFLSLTSLYPWPRHLTSLGNVSTMKQIGTTFLALLHAGLNSKCINLKNPLKVVGFCWLTLVQVHISQFHCASTYGGMQVIFSYWKTFFSSVIRYGLTEIFFWGQQFIIKRQFYPLFMCLYFGSIFNSIKYWHLQWTFVTSHHHQHILGLVSPTQVPWISLRDPFLFCSKQLEFHLWFANKDPLSLFL